MASPGRQSPQRDHCFAFTRRRYLGRSQRFILTDHKSSNMPRKSDVQTGATAIILVTAEASTRFCRPKQLVVWNGEPLLRKSAALDYAAQNIRVNAVCPDIIATPMMERFTGGTHEGEQRVIAQEPIGRMGKPEEIAATVVWLCSDAAAFIIGHAMVVDGRPSGIVMFVVARRATSRLRKRFCARWRQGPHDRESSQLLDGRCFRRVPIAQTRKRTIKKSYGHEILLY